MPAASALLGLRRSHRRAAGVGLAASSPDPGALVAVVIVLPGAAVGYLAVVGAVTVVLGPEPARDASPPRCRPGF
jgi:hypothetical protein